MSQELVLQRVADSQIVLEGDRLDIHIHATYPPDSTLISLTTNPPLPDFIHFLNAIFEDSTSGHGLFFFSPNYFQSGTYGITFIATVNTGTTILVDSQHVTITVIDVNRPPIIAPIPDTNVVEGKSIVFTVSVSDSDDTFDTLYTLTLPPNASFVNNGDNTGTFRFDPSYVQAGTDTITFYATDGEAIDSQKVVITVIDAGNQRPIIDTIPAQHVREGELFQIPVTATDSDETIPSLSIINLPANASFVDSHNGHGLFTMTPDSTQLAPFTISFVASDGFLADTMVVPVFVLANNLPPVLDTIKNSSVDEGKADTFYVHATDPYFGQITYTAIPMPSRNATFESYGTDSMRFIFSPDYFQAGFYSITFYARNAVNVDSQIVTITVINVNRRPVLQIPVRDTSIDEKQTLSFTVTVSDLDSTIDVLTTSSLPPNASFVDHHNDTADFIFTPNGRQSGTFHIAFYASDGQPKDSIDTVTVRIIVIDLAPTLTLKGTSSVKEGRYLIDTLIAVDRKSRPIQMSISPPPGDTSYHGRVYFHDNDSGRAIVMYFPKFSKVPDTVATTRVTVSYLASTDLDTAFMDTGIKVIVVRKDANDTLDADTLTVIGGEWDGIGSVVLHAKISNDNPIAGALTGFRWYDKTLTCDSVVMNHSIFASSDSSLYQKTRIYNDSLEFDCEFLFFDGKSLAPPGGDYFTAYFSYSGSWGPMSFLLFDSTKIGSTGDFVFDRRIRSMAMKDADRAEFALSTESEFTYRPLLLLDQVTPVQPVDVGHTPEPVIPKVFSLAQNYPNPFNPSTTIRFSVAHRSNIRLEIYNILGQEVAVLADGVYLPGQYRVSWDGRDRGGISVASGIYLYRLVADGISETKKMILLK